MSILYARIVPVLGCQHSAAVHLFIPKDSASMRDVLSRCLVAIALTLTACQGSQATYEEFSSESGNFTIDAPETLEETQQSVQTPVGPIDIHTFTTESENSAYVVAYSDYPSEIMEQTDPETLLNSSRDGAINNLGGTLVSEEDIDLDGNPGRSLVIDTAAGTEEAATINSRIYLVDNRLYQVLVVVPEGEEKVIDSTAFLESFELN
jgi:hypothetical protein